jgi:hypothetical protein
VFLKWTKVQRRSEGFTPESAHVVADFVVCTGLSGRDDNRSGDAGINQCPLYPRKRTMHRLRFSLHSAHIDSLGADP